mgnify:CR=1 FL=1
MKTEMIDRSTARSLAAKNKHASAVIICEENGWQVRLIVGASELGVRPDDSRPSDIWPSVDQCLAFVGELDLEEIDLQVSQVDTNPIGTDPEYDDWIRIEVQLAIDDPRPLVPQEEVERYFAMRRAELRKRIAAG